jgi:hypothetical protein
MALTAHQTTAQALELCAFGTRVSGLGALGRVDRRNGWGPDQRQNWPNDLICM